MKLFFRQKMLMGGHRMTYKTENYYVAKTHKLKLKKNIFYNKPRYLLIISKS